MLRIEKKVIEFVEKYMIIIAAVLITGIAFYIRRQCIWYYSKDYIYYFDKHLYHPQSSLYYLIVKGLGYLPLIPIQSVKWLTILGDFAVAVLAVCYIRLKKADTYQQIHYLFFYSACLFSPVIFLRGAVWAQIDSVAMALLLAALCFKHKEKDILAVILAIISTLLYPCFGVVVLIYACKNRKKLNRIHILTYIISLVLIQIISLVIFGDLATNGISGLNWLSYHPQTGERFDDILVWSGNIFLYFSYALALISGIVAYLKKISGKAAVTIQIIIAVLYGYLLF